MAGNDTPRKKPFIDDALKDELKREADILDLFRLFGLAEQKIRPTSKPDQFKAKCGFPDCKTANPHDFPMGINTEKNTFNCFHCGKGGDILKAIMQLKGLNFYNSKVFLHELIRGNNQAIQNVVITSRPRCQTKRQTSPPKKTKPTNTFINLSAAT